MIRALSAGALALALSVAATAPADAARKTTISQQSFDNDGRATQVSDRQRAQRQASHQPQRRDRQRSRHPRHAAGLQVAVIGGRPAGCPSRYCGCSTSLKIFGRIRPELNLAANWLVKFPRTAPAPGMAAARVGHVMVLLEHMGGDDWKVWDANSGGGLTRIHVRSIRGFGVVNPYAARFAAILEQSDATD